MVDRGRFLMRCTIIPNIYIYVEMCWWIYTIVCMMICTIIAKIGGYGGVMWVDRQTISATITRNIR